MPYKKGPLAQKCNVCNNMRNLKQSALNTTSRRPTFGLVDALSVVRLRDQLAD